MYRSRRSIGLLLTVLTVVGLMATTTAPTLARDDPGPEPHPRWQALFPRGADRTIQGHVVDQFGHLVDDASVEARDASGAVVASALTYAGVRADSAQHGFFRLEVGRPGTYTLTLARDGYESRTTDPIRVTRADRRIRLGNLELAEVLVATTTIATTTAGSAWIARAEHGRVQVFVAATPATGPTPLPTGRMEIRSHGKLIGVGHLGADDAGLMTVRLRRLGAGDHTFKAHFLGSRDLAPSTSRLQKLTVTK